MVNEDLYLLTSFCTNNAEQVRAAYTDVRGFLLEASRGLTLTACNISVCACSASMRELACPISKSTYVAIGS
jgi:hypothetical protein